MHVMQSNVCRSTQEDGMLVFNTPPRLRIHFWIEAAHVEARLLNIELHLVFLPLDSVSSLRIRTSQTGRTQSSELTLVALSLLELNLSSSSLLAPRARNPLVHRSHASCPQRPNTRNF